MQRSRDELAAEAAAALRAWSGRDPSAVWASPGRVNLIGEHTDYNDGFVLPFAIDRSTVVAAARRDDGLLRCWSLREHSRGEHSPQEDGPHPSGGPRPVTVELGGIAPGNPGGWAAYPAGSAWALAREGVVLPGADLVVGGDLPVGAGLSSSAALTCACVGALAQLAGAVPEPLEMARLARAAEVEIAGVPCGVMDQIACVLGRAGHALFLDTRTLATELIPMKEDAAGLRLLVIDTRAEHRLVEGAYAHRRADCHEAARLLGVRALRDATPEQVAAAEGALGPRLTRRARHVTGENARVLETAALLRAGQPERLGGLLAASHASLRDDFEVSSPELDVAVAAATGAAAVGARMTGAGFGGSALALVGAAEVPKVTEAVNAAFAAASFRAPAILEVHPAQGAASMR